MAEAYGRLPSEVLRARPHEHSRMDLFRFNSDVFAATSQYKAWQRERERDNQASAHDGPGTATQREKDRLVDAQHDRAARREQRADDTDTTTAAGLDALAAKRRDREQARAGFEPNTGE